MISERTLEVLEFPKIRQLLKKQCSTVLGEERALRLKPSDDPDTVARWLGELTEAEEVLARHEPPSLTGIHDLRAMADRAAVGGSLGGEELWKVYTTLAAARGLRNFSDRLPEHLSRWRMVADRIVPLPDLEQDLGWCISPEGGVLDRASAKLSQIRREIRASKAEIKERLDRYLRTASTQKMLQDFLVTQRENRYVLPVKQEYRHQFPGLVHGQSASGMTLFIEPMAVVELNNRLRILSDREQEEVAAILARLSGQVGQSRAEIVAGLEAIGQLDFLLAKAQLARDQDASCPEINVEHASFKLKSARHPLLPKDRVIPIDISLGEDYDVLVITGPNTGGKTVTLKTVGLLCAMAQSGLYLPVAPGSEMAVYASIFSDIGDEQSIEQSLSTFSGHLKNIVDILHSMELPSLVLLDELGAGTDPAEGAALAQAILEDLQEKGAKVLVSTHLGQLKIYAHQAERVANAAVEFDSQRLQPTYRLYLGLPGRSNALEVAESLGLDRGVAQRARDLLGEEQQELGKILASLEEERREYFRLHTEAERKAKELERELAEFHRVRQEFEVKREEAFRQARHEMRILVKQAQAETKAIVRELRAALDEEGRRAADRTLEKGQAGLRNIIKSHDLPYEQEETSAHAPLAATSPGQRVWIPRLQQTGTVIEANEADASVQVAVGNMRLQLPLKDLEQSVETSRKDSKKDRSRGSVSLVAREAVEPSIMIRGMTVDEALGLVDKYLDNAILAGLGSVVVIHGKGTGTLRRAVHSYLETHPTVKSFRLGQEGEGGSGVTVVSFV